MNARGTQKEQPQGEARTASPRARRTSQDDRPRRHTMSDQKGDWRIVGQVATGFGENFTVRVQPITWERFLERYMRERGRIPGTHEPKPPG